MLTTLVASVGAGGIPSGSFVTMPLIFAAVRLPVDKIPILLTVDWLLDRCRTTSNVLGDMTVAVLLDRVSPPDVREANPSGRLFLFHMIPHRNHSQSLISSHGSPAFRSDN